MTGGRGAVMAVAWRAARTTGITVWQVVGRWVVVGWFGGLAGVCWRGIGGRVPSSSPMKMWARSRSIPPPAPEAFKALARAVIRAIAAAACGAGRLVPVSVAVPSSSGYKLTRARRSAALRRSSAPSGSAIITARRSRDRSWAYVNSPAPGRTSSSTRRAVSSSSRLVASLISRAR
ncbi:MAG TPA: hypothetical protein VGG25_20360 [Streptosporangiaceae bacterium]